MSESEVSVKIETDIYEYLKTRSTFEDTLSSVLRRELGLPTSSKLLQASEHQRSQEEIPYARNSGPGPQQREETARVGRQTPRSITKPTKRKRTRAAAGTLLPEAEYHRPILEILADLGKSAPKQVVIDELGRRLDGRLTEADRDTLSSGIVRWESRAQFARLRLVDRGYLDKRSPRGTWTIRV
jgi:hypothetical protein